MTNNNNPYPVPLHIYKASAGSGKTFRLAVDYISLLMEDPTCFRKILAVTFTNKATGEMKQRIVSTLYALAMHLGEGNDYMQAVMDKTGLKEEEIVNRAQMALTYLLHHYSDFRIQTIDAFFQTIMRNLATELELTTNFRIDLNDAEVEGKAVDALINELDEQSKVFKWITDYIRVNIDEDHSWKVIEQIKTFGTNIFNDVYKKHAEEMDRLFSTPHFFEDYTKELRSLRDNSKRNIINAYQAMMDKIKAHNLDDENFFAYTNKGVYAFIRRMASGNIDGKQSTRITDCATQPQKWVRKGTGMEDEVLRLATSDLCTDLRNAEEMRPQEWSNYQSASVTLRHLNELRLLKVIADTVDELNRAANRFQLSETQSLLKALVKGTDTPFVFEKIGSRLLHIMIDEFQDTSTIQWDNFKLLLNNCIDQAGSHSLIVGDVKQSIYRWRMGDWTLLNNIGQDYDKSRAQIDKLDTNYRSQENIVNFNNTFFTLAAAWEALQMKEQQIPHADTLSKAYEDVVQKPKKSGGKGYVEISLLPAGDDYKENVYQCIFKYIKNLLEAGVSQKSIAILVRVNKDIADIAQAFTENPLIHNGRQVRLVSDEAFRLDTSVSVRIIIAALQALAHPMDVLTKAVLVKEYHNKILKDNRSDNSLLIITKKTERLADTDIADRLDRELPEAFIQGRNKLIAMPFTDLIEELYTIFQLHDLPGDYAYFCAFNDCVTDFLDRNTADIDMFLNEWTNHLHKKTIETGEIDGIRILSIHKSKGLEFGTVIIPFCDWKLEQSNTIWCERKEEKHFDVLPLIPIDYSESSMRGTVYQDDYCNEHLQNTVDNLNVLYVGFTRPKRNLFVIGKRLKSDKTKKKTYKASMRSEVIEHNLKKTFEILQNSNPSGIPISLNGTDDPKQPITFSYGAILPDEQEEKKKTENVFEEKPSMLMLNNINVYNGQAEFMQSNKSKEFVASVESPKAERMAYIKRGNVLHNLFAHIRTLDDVEPRLRELQAEGIVDNNEQAEELKNIIRQSISQPEVHDWFSDRWTLFNECTIINTGSKDQRPDRVMTDGKEMIVVDFKFGDHQEKHKKQVSDYMDLLCRMGYEHVSGYIWYVLEKEVVPVVNKKKQ